MARFALLHRCDGIMGMSLANIVGLIGVAAYLAAYGLLQLGKLKVEDDHYILLNGIDELGFHPIYEFVHHMEDAVHDVAGIGGVLAWIVNTLASALIGLVVGSIVVAVMTGVSSLLAKRRGGAVAQEH